MITPEQAAFIVNEHGVQPDLWDNKSARFHGSGPVPLKIQTMTDDADIAEAIGEASHYKKTDP